MYQKEVSLNSGVTPACNFQDLLMAALLYYIPFYISWLISIKINQVLSIFVDFWNYWHVTHGLVQFFRKKDLLETWIYTTFSELLTLKMTRIICLFYLILILVLVCVLSRLMEYPVWAWEWLGYPAQPTLVRLCFLSCTRHTKVWISVCWCWHQKSGSSFYAVKGQLHAQVLCIIVYLMIFTHK